MQRLKAGIFFTGGLMLGGILSVLLPLGSLMATNTLKGAGSNPEGEWFIPLGIFLLLLALALTGLGLTVAILYRKSAKYGMRSAVAGLLLGAVLTALWWELSYSTPHPLFFWT